MLIALRMLVDVVSERLRSITSERQDGVADDGHFTVAMATQAGEMKKGLYCAFLARSTKKTSDCLVRHAVIGGNLAKGFLILKDTAQHVRPFVRGNTLL